LDNIARIADSFQSDDYCCYCYPDNSLFFVLGFCSRCAFSLKWIQRQKLMKTLKM